MHSGGRNHLWELPNRAGGVVVFATTHKFMPENGEAMPYLSARQNIVVIADEAHRIQYGFVGKVNEKTGQMFYGLSSNLRDDLIGTGFSAPDRSVDAVGVDVPVSFKVPVKKLLAWWEYGRCQLE